MSDNTARAMFWRGFLLGTLSPLAVLAIGFLIWRFS